MGMQGSLPSGADNDFYFSVIRNGAEHVVAMIQDSASNVQMNFTGQHRCKFDGDYNTNLMAKIFLSFLK